MDVRLLSRLRDQRIARVKTLSGRPSPAIEADDVTQVGKSAGLLSHEEEIRLSDLYKRGCQLKSTKAQLTEKIGKQEEMAIVDRRPQWMIEVFDMRMPYLQVASRLWPNGPRPLASLGHRSRRVSGTTRMQSSA